MLPNLFPDTHEVGLQPGLGGPTSDGGLPPTGCLGRLMGSMNSAVAGGECPFCFLTRLSSSRRGSRLSAESAHDRKQ